MGFELRAGISDRVVAAPVARLRFGLIVATALSSGLVVHRPAQAQDAASLSSIQAQIAQLQSQLKRLQRQAAARDEALRSAQADAAQARADAAQAVSRTATYAAASRGMPLSAPPGYYPQGPAPAMGSGMAMPNSAATSLQSASPASITTTAVDKTNPVLRLGGVTVTLGGYFDTTEIYRSRNLTSATSTPFNAIPYDNSANAHVSEFRMTAQPTRFSVLAQGSSGTGKSLAAYLEGDFNGAATTSNSNQTNSYTPRVRLAYTTFDDKVDGLHLLVGQEWSLATGSTVGITPRKELIPATIDASYVVGWVYTRAPQIRVVKDFGGKFWLGASIEAPQETYSSAVLTASPATLPNGSTLTFNNPGGGYLNQLANYSYDTAPDVVIKAAADTGFGHYEAYGLGRAFRTHTALLGVGNTDTVLGGGVGGDLSIHVIPKYLDLVGNVLVGDGIGRYGAGQLPDATFDASGHPVPLRGSIGLVGLIAHPSPSFDLYGYVGSEQTAKSTFATSVTKSGVTTTTGYGYGTPLASNSGCVSETFSCSAQTRALDDITVGAWWRFLQGGFGTVQAGVQYEYVKKIAFSGKGGRPETDDNMVYFSLRYLPFQ